MNFVTLLYGNDLYSYESFVVAWQGEAHSHTIKELLEQSEDKLQQKKCSFYTLVITKIVLQEGIPTADVKCLHNKIPLKEKIILNAQAKKAMSGLDPWKTVPETLYDPQPVDLFEQEVDHD